MVLAGKDASDLAKTGLETAGLSEGLLLGYRYRLLHPVDRGWSAYDERLQRTVFVEPIVREGETPQQRIRSEAAFGAALLDAVVCGDAAFAVRVRSASSA
jgi:hypothetical protein